MVAVNGIQIWRGVPLVAIGIGGGLMSLCSALQMFVDVQIYAVAVSVTPISSSGRSPLTSP
jgi:hypothetical protein